MTKLSRPALYMTGVGAVFLNSALVWPTLALTLSADRFGTLVQLLSFAALGGPVVTLGLHVYALRHMVSASAEHRRSAAAITTGVTRLLAVVLVVGWVIQPRGTIGTAIVLLTVQGIALVGAGALRGHDRPVWFAIQTVLTQVLPLVLIAASPRLGIDDPGDFVVPAFLIAGTAGLATTEIWTLRGRWPRRREVSAALRFGVPLLPHLVAAAGLLQVARLAVGQMAGASAAASFQFAALLGGAGITVVQVAMSHLTTDALRSESDFVKRLDHARLNGLGLCVLIAAALTVFEFILLDLWLPDYVNAAYVVSAVALMTFAFPAQVTGDGYMAILMQRGSTKFVSLSTLAGVSMTVAVLASIPLWPRDLASVTAGAAVALGIYVRALAARALTPRGIAPDVGLRERAMWLSVFALAGLVYLIKGGIVK